MKHIKIARVETYGVKNITKKITIDFLDQMFNAPLTKVSNVKGIYGPTGVGKSAIIDSLYVLNEIFRGIDIVNDTLTIDSLRPLLNKELNEFFIKVIFEVKELRFETKYYSYLLNVKFDDDKFKIVEENFNELIGTSLNNYTSYLIYQYDGINLTFNKDAKFDYEDLKEVKLDFLKGLPFITRYSIEYFKHESIPYDYEFDLDYHLFNLLQFLRNLYVYRSLDANYQIGRNYLVTKSKTAETKLNKEYKSLLELYRYSNPNFVGFEYEYIKDKHSYYLIKNKYKDYLVNLKDDSIGMKHLLTLDNIIKHVLEDKIVIVDDISNDIDIRVLNALLEILVNQKLGQLIFTSKDVLTMNPLRRKKKAIYFIKEDLNISTWVINGHYSPVDQYLNNEITKESNLVDSLKEIYKVKD